MKSFLNLRIDIEIHIAKDGAISKTSNDVRTVAYGRRREMNYLLQRGGFPNRD
jgi:hypothetical protein